MRRQRSVFRTLAEPLAVAVTLAFIVRAVLRIYTIPSSSMLPTLAAGDHIIVVPYLLREPARGDVVVFRSLSDANELVVKRIIAGAGELVEARVGRVRVGGHTLSEPYLLQQAADGAFAAQVVAPDSYFVMGDNRAASFDSRHWGALPRARIIGRARMVLWSSGSSTPPGAPPFPAASPDGGSRLFKWID